MLQELGNHLKDEYPFLPEGVRVYAVLLCLDGCVAAQGKGTYLVTDPAIEADEVTPMVLHVERYGAQLSCSCRDLLPPKEEQAQEDDEALDVCAHQVAVSLYEYDQAQGASAAHEAPEHSVTLSGYTPEGFSFLDCFRGTDIRAMRKEMVRVSRVYKEAGFLPHDRFPQRFTQAAQEAKPTPAPEQEPAPAQTTTEAARPVQGVRGGAKKDVQVEGAFVTRRIRTETNQAGYYWKVMGDSMPKGTEQYGITLSEAVLRTVANPGDFKSEGEREFAGYMAYYGTGDTGKKRIVRLERL